MNILGLHHLFNSPSATDPFGRVVFEICEQTERHTDINSSHTFR